MVRKNKGCGTADAPATFKSDASKHFGFKKEATCWRGLVAEVLPRDFDLVTPLVFDISGVANATMRSLQLQDLSSQSALQRVPH